jgi:hypothetical protein
MLHFLQGKATERKLRLFGVGCCRRIWDLLPEQWSRRAVQVAERYVDGGADVEQLKEAGKKAGWAAAWAGQGAAAEAAAWVASGGGAEWVEVTAARARSAETGNATHSEFQCALLRDLFGNPFRPVALDPAWRTSAVVSLAQAVYDRQAFKRMSELADALEEAGCAGAAIPAHCRSQGSHVRGCWVLDLLLGKE